VIAGGSGETTNYLQDWDEYERLYYGIWADEDKTRDSERSSIVTPAIRQAVDNKVAELLEGISGKVSTLTLMILIHPEALKTQSLLRTNFMMT
jgi:hypothetical protein